MSNTPVASVPDDPTEVNTKEAVAHDSRARTIQGVLYSIFR